MGFDMQNMPDEQYFLDHVQPIAAQFRERLGALAGMGPDWDGSHVLHLAEPRFSPLPDNRARFDAARFETDFTAAVRAVEETARIYLNEAREFQRRRREDDWT